MASKFEVNSPDVQYSEASIESRYEYHTTAVSMNDKGQMVATPQTTVFNFRTQRKVSRVPALQEQDDLGAKTC